MKMKTKLLLCVVTVALIACFSALSVSAASVRIPFHSDKEVCEFFDKSVTGYSSADYQHYAFYFTGNGMSFYFFHNDTQFTQDESKNIYSSLNAVKLIIGVDGTSKGFSISKPNVPYNSSVLFVSNFDLSFDGKEVLKRNVQDYFLEEATAPPDTGNTDYEATVINRLDMVVTILLFTVGFSIAVLVVILLYKFLRSCF